MFLKNYTIYTYENLKYRNKVRKKSIYIVILFSIIIFISLLPFIKIDVSTQGRGILRSLSEPVSINSIVNARVTNNYLKNNLFVKEGDTLLVLNTETILLEKNNLLKILEEQKKLQTDLKNITSQKIPKLETSSLKEEYLVFQSAYKEIKNKIIQAQNALQRNKKLFDKGLISKTEYEPFYFNYSQLLSVEKNIKSKYFSEWENKLISTQEKIIDLENNLNRINDGFKNYFIVAPISGVIENFSGVQEGSFILSSQTIATISPMNELIAEIYISPKDIGLIQKNQEVRFQIDAFNYNQWGTITGKIIDIDKNITKNNENFFFKIRCSLNTNILFLKNGYRAEISNGMTLTAHFIINQRSLYELLFDKVDNWLNPTQSIQ